MAKHLELTLQEGFEYTGLWWLPEDTEKEIGGTLSYSPIDGIHLALLGTFNSESIRINNNFETDVVNGVTSNGILCTLFSNVQVDYSFNVPGFYQQKLVSNLLVMGRHFSSFDELIFTKWRISYENLDDWIAPSLFESGHSTDADDIRTVTVVAKPENYFDQHVDAVGCRIVLTADMLSGIGDASGQFSLSKEPFFELTPVSKQSYEKFKRWLNDIESLLSVFMVDTIQPRKIHGILSDNKEDDFSERQSLGIFPRLKHRPVTRTTRWNDMLMTLADIEDHLATALERWFDAEHNVRQAIILFFAETDRLKFDLDTQFTNIVHALESYHRSISEGHYLSVEQYQPYLDMMVQAIPAEIDPDHRRALKSRLKFGYQYSQRKRFQELFDLINVDLQCLVTSNVPVFINKVVDTRNYLVHRDETSKGMTLEWPERLFAYRRLRMLMTILFLKFIGLEDDAIYQHMSKNSRVKQFIGSDKEEE